MPLLIKTTFIIILYIFVVFAGFITFSMIFFLCNQKFNWYPFSLIDHKIVVMTRNKQEKKIFLSCLNKKCILYFGYHLPAYNLLFLGSMLLKILKDFVDPI